MVYATIRSPKGKLEVLPAICRQSFKKPLLKLTFSSVCLKKIKKQMKGKPDFFDSATCLLITECCSCGLTAASLLYPPTPAEQPLLCTFWHQHHCKGSLIPTSACCTPPRPIQSSHHYTHIQHSHKAQHSTVQGLMLHPT